MPASPAVPVRARVHVTDFLLPASLALWALGIRRTNTAALGPFGLLTELPIVFYTGLALLVISAGIELARRTPSPWRMGLHVVALVVMLYGTAPLVYSEGRYSWLYKTVGVVQYVNAHGQLDRHIDIYQNWPGFFALAAWFGKVAGVTNPLAYAKWAQLAFELAALPLLYLIYDALSLTVARAMASPATVLGQQLGRAGLLLSASSRDTTLPGNHGDSSTLAICGQLAQESPTRPGASSRRSRIPRLARYATSAYSGTLRCSSARLLRADRHARAITVHAGSSAWGFGRRPTSAAMVARYPTRSHRGGVPDTTLYLCE